MVAFNASGVAELPKDIQIEFVTVLKIIGI